jgi:hypothetical protein
MNEEIQREEIQKLIKKLKLKNTELNALGVMLLISRREKMKDRISNRKDRKKRGARTS